MVARVEEEVGGEIEADAAVAAEGFAAGTVVVAAIVRAAGQVAVIGILHMDKVDPCAEAKVGAYAVATGAGDVLLSDGDGDYLQLVAAGRALRYLYSVIRV